MGEKTATVKYTTTEEKRCYSSHKITVGREPHTSRERPQHPTSNAVPQTPPTAASRGELCLIHPHKQLKERAAPQVTFTQQIGRRPHQCNSQRSHSHTSQTPQQQAKEAAPSSRCINRERVVARRGSAHSKTKENQVCVERGGESSYL